MTMPAKKADNQSSISLIDEEEPLRRAMANFKPAKSGAMNRKRRSAKAPNAGDALPVEGALPSLDGAIVMAQLAAADGSILEGVLVDFWTYSCINCLRSIPYVRAWAVHAPDSPSRNPCRTSRRPWASWASAIRSPSTMIMRSGALSTTSTGRRTILSMPRGASATTILAKANTTSPRKSSSNCWSRPARRAFRLRRCQGRRAGTNSQVD
jgi:hypothetical protein